jgi:Ankyrin repeats (3 copies)/Ankyrin repeats (many copies)
MGDVGYARRHHDLSAQRSHEQPPGVGPGMRWALPLLLLLALLPGEAEARKKSPPAEVSPFCAALTARPIDKSTFQRELPQASVNELCPIHQVRQRGTMETLAHVGLGVVTAGLWLVLADSQGWLDSTQVQTSWYSPLSLAVQRRELWALQALLKEGADPEQDPGQTRPPLAVATLDALEGRRDALAMVDALVAARARAGRPDLFTVEERLRLCRKGAVVQRLVPGGWRPDGLDANGTSALHEAVRRNDMEGLQACLSLGASINAVDQEGLSPLHLAMKLDRVETAGKLVKMGASLEALPPLGRSAAHVAVEMDAVPWIGRLKKLGAPLDLPDAAGFTPLHRAILGGTQPMIDALLAAGASPGPQGAKGHTALGVALRAGRYPVVEQLVASGQSLEERDGQGRSLLDIADEENLMQAMDWLLQHGLSPCLPGPDGQTRLRRAIARDDRALVERWLSREAWRCEAGPLPLRPSQLELLRRLDEVGASTEVSGGLRAVVEANQLNMLRYLIGRGARLDTALVARALELRRDELLPELIAAAGLQPEQARQLLRQARKVGLPRAERRTLRRLRWGREAPLSPGP